LEDNVDLNYVPNDYKVYSFVGKDMIKECVAIARLYNFCIQTHNSLGLVDKR